MKTYTARMGAGIATVKASSIPEAVNKAAEMFTERMGFVVGDVCDGVRNGEGWIQCSAELAKATKRGCTIRPISFQVREADQAALDAFVGCFYFGS